MKIHNTSITPTIIEPLIPKSNNTKKIFSDQTFVQAPITIGEHVLNSYTIPANTLNNLGDSIVISYRGRKGSGTVVADNSRLIFPIGENIFTTGYLGDGGFFYTVTLTFTRETDTTNNVQIELIGSISGLALENITIHLTTINNTIDFNYTEPYTIELKAVQDQEVDIGQIISLDSVDVISYILS